MNRQGRVTAVLGPTNTGKTHYAIERMLAHRTGVIGLPLRLLAREVYDRIKALRGPSVVALVTGEERIVPDRVHYWVCTTEAMPLEIGADFVAVDEIQLCADPDRGHVFTERLLHARGLHETLFLGSDTMRGAIAALVPGAQFIRRERMSELSWAGSKKIARMPARAAIVAFSVENVYAIAELIRRTKGGCAIVMGALSPRTRNAQVELYQNGDVDYLVATDAIGMGLNLDIRHVAFAGTGKFDGRRMRPLMPDELAQIAGRAGRHTQAGTFGVTGEARPLPPETVAAIENHQFLPVRKLQWRNARLDFGSLPRLIASLEAPTSDDWLTRVREADDLLALRSLAEMPEVTARLHDARDLRLLWDICRIPDFRGISAAEHAGLLARLHGFLANGGHIPADWLARNIARIDKGQGDIDMLSRRLAFIRTWTYVAQRPGWVDDEKHWRGVTRAVEDRLSDALHARLTAAFVDRRTSVLMRRLNQKESLVADVNDKGEVTVEGEFIGRLEGFRFRQDKTDSPDEARTLRQAAVAALAPAFHLRADRFYNAPDSELDFTEQGGLMWGTDAVGKLTAGPDALRPQVTAFVDDEAGADVAEKVKRRLQHFIDRKLAALFEPLQNLQRDEALSGLARGFAFRLVESMGVLPREGVAGEVKALDQEARGALRKHGVRFGQFTIFLPALLKPAPTRLRLVLWSLANGLDVFPESPPPGLVTIPMQEGTEPAHYTLMGYKPTGARAIRIDMLERLADLLRTRDSRAGFEATPDMLSITGLTLDQFADLMQGLGYATERGERPKLKPAEKPADKPVEGGAESAASAGTTPATLSDASPVEMPAETPAETPADPPPEMSPGAAAQDGATEVSTELATDSGPEASNETGTEQDAEASDPPAALTAKDNAATSAAATDDATAADASGTDATGPAAETASETAAEIEVFFTFRWAPRGRGPRREGRGHAQGQGTRKRQGGMEGKPDGHARRGPGGKGAMGDPAARADSQGKPGKQGKGGKSPRRDDGPRQFTAAPERKGERKGERKRDRIDPDNPFAAALMGLKDKQ